MLNKIKCNQSKCSKYTCMWQKYILLSNSILKELNKQYLYLVPFYTNLATDFKVVLNFSLTFYSLILYRIPTSDSLYIYRFCIYKGFTYYFSK